jgi:hypothetical protein
MFEYRDLGQPVHDLQVGEFSVLLQRQEHINRHRSLFGREGITSASHKGFQNPICIWAIQEVERLSNSEVQWYSVGLARRATSISPISSDQGKRASGLSGQPQVEGLGWDVLLEPSLQIC